MSNLFDSGIRPAVDDWLLQKAQEKRDYGDYWSASSAGYCQRRVIFERLGVPHVESDDDARKQRVFTSGHLFHDWIQGITKEAGLSIASEVELQDEDLMVRGHFDDLVLVDGKLILYDYKTVNSRSFMWAKKNGSEMSYYHRLQLGTYMYMLRRGSYGIPPNEHTTGYNEGQMVGKENFFAYPQLTEARILKIEKDTLMMREQQLLWSPELESEVLDYWNSLNAHWKAKTLPKCSCEAHEGGFLAREKYNPFYYQDSPCSLEWYALCKKEGRLK